MVKQFGVRAVMVAGGFMASLGLIIGSFANSIYVIFVSFGLITGMKFQLLLKTDVFLKMQPSFCEVGK